MGFWPPFLLSTGCVLFVLNLLYFLKDFLAYLFIYHAGVINSFLLLLYFQPSLLVLAIPISFLTGLLVVFGRLSADRETIALESCGFSLGILIWPMIGISFLFSLFMVAFMDVSLPWGNTSFLKLEYKIITERSAVVVREGSFIKDFEGFTLYVGQKDDRTDELKNVKVFILNDKGDVYRVIFAKEGTLRQDPGNYRVLLDLRDGEMQQVGNKKEITPLDEFLQMKFKGCVLDLTSKRLRGGVFNVRDARNISIRELADKIKTERKEGKVNRYDESEFYKKFSIPFSALAFAFIGIPLGLMSKSGSFFGFFMALSLVMVYWLFIMFGDAGGPLGLISPFLAMWLPNVVLTCVGAVLVYRLNHRHNFIRSFFRRDAVAKTPGHGAGSIRIAGRK
jgi:lipopolysaccharide export system permease protein